MMIDQFVGHIDENWSLSRVEVTSETRYVLAVTVNFTFI
jgi:hypothetical protein